MGDKVK